MPNPAFIEGKRAERRAAPKPARIPAGDRQTYSFDEGLGKRAERRANIGQRPMVLGRHGQSAGTARVRPQFTKPAAHWRVPSSGRLVPGEGLGGLAQRGLQGRQTYSFDKGLQ